jgi:hypothetical protein
MTKYVTINISDGFGNQMFKVACLLGYAERFGHTPVFLEEPKISKDHSESLLKLQNFIAIPVKPELAKEQWTVLKEAHEHAFTYNAILEINGNVYLDGYFQSELYFPKQGLPTSVPSPPSIHTEFLNIDWSSVFFLHIRRGDYMHPANRHHQIDVETYVRKAMREFSRHTCFVASDDIAWCNQVLPTWFPDQSWIICPAELSDAETLFWMSLCGLGGICANSSFSWWAAYFLRLSAPEATICMPYPWGTRPLPEARDLYPRWAKKIDWSQ